MSVGGLGVVGLGQIDLEVQVCTRRVTGVAFGAQLGADSNGVVSIHAGCTALAVVELEY